MNDQYAAIFNCHRSAQPSVFVKSQRLILHNVGFVERRAGQVFHRPLHHDPDTTELMLIREGVGQFKFDRKDYTAREGNLLVYNKGIWHEEHSGPDGSFRTVYVSFSGLNVAGLPEGFLIERISSPMVSLGERFFGIEQRLLEIHTVLSENGVESDYIADQLLGALLGEIVAVVAGPGTKAPGANMRVSTLVAVARRHIHENYSKRLTLVDLGIISSASPSYLCRVFNAQTGYSPIDYLISYRIGVAKELLRTTDHKISVIAGLVGYNSETYFQATFRRIVGMPAGKYRTEHRLDGFEDAG